MLVEAAVWQKRLEEMVSDLLSTAINSSSVNSAATKGQAEVWVSKGVARATCLSNVRAPFRSFESLTGAFKMGSEQL